MPQISVIVPVYKVEPYLHRCVDSILAQTFTDFELILVDDGSPDNCGKICDEYAEKDSRIKVIHQENGGLSAARNAGLDWVFANSSSEWISFVDSDDYVSQFYLEELFLNATKENSELSICSYKRVDKEENEVEFTLQLYNSTISKVDAFKLIAEKPWIVIACAKLFKRVIFANIRFPVGRLHEDEYIIHHILWQCEKIVLSSHQLYFYVKRNDSIMSAKSLTGYLDGIEGHLDRYYFCKEHNLPFDVDIMMSQYCGIRNYNKKITEEEQQRIKKIIKEYRIIYFSAPQNSTIKRKLWFHFNRTYTVLYKIKNKIWKQ